MLHAQCGKFALQFGVPCPGVAFLVLAAVIVDIHVTIGTQARVDIVGGIAASIGKGKTVLHNGTLRPCAQVRLPVGVDLVVNGKLHVCAGALKGQ